jgi:ribosomal protein S18 acetylase RimI-like enzyme
VRCLPHHRLTELSRAKEQLTSSSWSALYLVPIREYHDDFTFLAKSDEYRCHVIDRHGKFENKHDLALVEENDLPDVARFVVGAFGSDAITLSQDLNAFEKLLMTPAVDLVNGYSGIVAFAEVLAGLRSRLHFRMKSSSRRMDLMSPPNLDGLSRAEQIRMAAQTSLVLALAKPHSDDDGKNDWHCDVIASIELRLEPCDAKIPFSLPWIDRIERFLASLVGRLGKNNNARDFLQPYLSNLCVDESLRGKGIGRALVRCVENIAKTNWGYSRMYLHVDVDNKAALELYTVC